MEGHGAADARGLASPEFNYSIAGGFGIMKKNVCKVLADQIKYYEYIAEGSA